VGIKHAARPVLVGRKKPYRFGYGFVVCAKHCKHKYSKKFDYLCAAMQTPASAFLPDLAPILAVYFALKKMARGLPLSL
jgi:hypothetical protein